MLGDELPCQRSEGVCTGLGLFDAAAMLVGGVLGDDVAAHLALAVDVGREQARSAQRKWHPDHRLALQLLAREADRPERELRAPAAGAAEPQRPGLRARGLDDKMQTSRPGIGNLAPLAGGGVLAHGGIGQVLGHGRRSGVSTGQTTAGVMACYNVGSAYSNKAQQHWKARRFPPAR